MTDKENKCESKTNKQTIHRNTRNKLYAIDIEANKMSYIDIHRNKVITLEQNKH